MHSLNIQAMQWQPVADISAVQSLQTDDLACFRELRDVLQRYGALERFGISLIHRHFDIADDEEMMEYTDAQERILTVKPVKKSDIDWEATTITNWKLTEGDEVARIGCGSRAIRAPPGLPPGHLRRATVARQAASAFLTLGLFQSSPLCASG